MTGLKAKAIAAFEKEVEKRKAAAKMHFKKDFGIDPDETGYLGDHRFLFRVDDLHIRGYIKYIGDYLYGKAYRLAKACGNCTEFIFGKKVFHGLAGLGEAIGVGFNSDICGDCGLSETGG